MTTNPRNGFVAFISDCLRWAFTGGLGFKMYLAVLLGLMVSGALAYGRQFQEGLMITGMSDIVSWGLYISNFTFFVGVAAAAVMLILPAYILKDRDLHEVVIIGEGVAVGALVMCLLFITVDMGGPLKVWHMIPGIGLFNWPSSILTWDMLVLNGYLALNSLVPLYILYSNYHGRKPVGWKYQPFVFLSIFWAVSIHMVTAFLYQGLPARPFWNNPLLGPRFLASAFAAGPAVIMMVLIVIKEMTNYPIDQNIFRKLKRIIVVAAVINLIMLFSEVFKEFYTVTHHSLSAQYLFFGLDGHDSLVPWIWSAISLNVLGTLLFAFDPTKCNPKYLMVAAISLFTGIWIEKGFGLIIPGFIPSPLGEVVDYSPSTPEILITLGILATGAFVVTILIKPALVIEHRFREGRAGSSA
ncbi:Hdr menaquinol oxidoreductase integral membrane subunit [Desulfolithobacter dissulfuricans]|uniref:Hdr menaquinol oxidoreductase integral membrane subunit n=1 Tax=Desulfolithobacter dissulfuricans TaxID=2795293 RepID=A0A915U528_9BACT|nr:NrfD/PsrC family molybdoenzyme membrane anchor subunit [Desulfolithobacter dissulfuricans]BCO08617.1 Hdr menaquinol oxidoreductase integral membrane subunit [Desulfolithobacter dissulfuricans]